VTDIVQLWHKIYRITVIRILYNVYVLLYCCVPCSRVFCIISRNLSRYYLCNSETTTYAGRALCINIYIYIIPLLYQSDDRFGIEKRKSRSLYAIFLHPVNSFNTLFFLLKVTVAMATKLPNNNKDNSGIQVYCLNIIRLYRSIVILLYRLLL